VITADTVAAALAISTSARRMHSGTGWFSDGHFAVRGEEYVALATELKERIATSVAEWTALKETTPVLEAVELWIPRKTERKKCYTCFLGEVKHDDCDDCGGHKCDDCGGSQWVDEVDDIGQMVFVANGGETLVNPVYGELLRGLTVARDAREKDPAIAMLLGFDDAGEMVVAVMPLRNPVRQPETGAPTAETAP
jgi:hypothetical protein